MADACSITKFSRRTMLAGGGAAISATALPSAAAPPDPDAELLRRLAEADRRWADYLAADAECTRLLRVLRQHPDYPGETLSTEAADWAREKVAVKTGYRAADNLCEHIYETYDAALRAAFAVPARTLSGLNLKMKTALKAAKNHDLGTFEESDYKWLDIAIADLGRIAR